ncbi:MAG: Na+/H+ antiporter subunit B [Verrucomicrobia bacterium]|nr:Na+/H+ antiporter subunit B [Verrucomicrobiota bacterium]
MSTLILRTATRYVAPLMLLFSIYLLLVGHSYPGGGFVGGLAASSAFALYALAYDVDTARKLMHLSPVSLSAIGLLLSALSGLIGMVHGAPYLTGQWTSLDLPGFDPIKIGTPLLFDLGVYLVVLGVTMGILFALAEEEG